MANINDLLQAWAGGGNVNDALTAKYGGSGSLNERERAYHGGAATDNLNDALVAAMGAGNLQDNLAAYYADLTLLEDSFTGANGTALGDHTPETGGPWTVHAGTPTLNGSGGLTDAETFVAAADCGAEDVTIVVEATEAAAFRAVFRLTDASNYWHAEYDGLNEFLRIYEVVAGAPTLRAGAGRTATDAPRTLTVTVAGASVSAALDTQTTPVTYDTMATGLAATAHGCGGASGCSIDSIAITG